MRTHITLIAASLAVALSGPAFGMGNDSSAPPAAKPAADPTFGRAKAMIEARDYKGALPPGKNPMKRQGSIVLGSGGDCCYSNNNASQGTFYEGAIVAGYPSDTTDSAIHTNIVSAGYGK